MKMKLYIDKGEPLVSCWPEKLSDGSEAWNLYLRGGEVIPCENERKADDAFRLMAYGIQLATGGNALIL